MPFSCCRHLVSHGSELLCGSVLRHWGRHPPRAMGSAMSTSMVRNPHVMVSHSSVPSLRAHVSPLLIIVLSCQKACPSLNWTCTLHPLRCAVLQAWCHPRGLGGRGGMSRGPCNACPPMRWHIMSLPSLVPASTPDPSNLPYSECPRYLLLAPSASCRSGSAPGESPSQRPAICEPSAGHATSHAVDVGRGAHAQGCHACRGT